MIKLRAGRDEDASGFIALVSACWAEYPGCVFDLDGEVPELRALATHVGNKRGALFVHDGEGRVAGMIAIWPTAEPGTWELGKMYVDRALRGRSVGAALNARAESHARANGARRIELWTDTRFERAHAFYEKRCFVRTGPIRALGDKSNTIEFHYAKPIDGLMALNAAGSASAVRSLTRLAPSCDWSKSAKHVAEGSDRLFAAWRNGTITAAVLVSYAPGQHRGTIAQLTGDAGDAETLLAAAQETARKDGLRLLIAQTLSGDVAETACRSSGWNEVGRVPDFEPGRDAVIFFKPVDG